MLDRLPDDPAWGNGRVAGSGEVMLHYIRLGVGDTVLLLHGWPGFWYDWRRVLEPLSGFADVIAPDFRGFGESDKPDLPPAEGIHRRSWRRTWSPSSTRWGSPGWL
jgi:pimeloyl-ACP methyl ester carboxylesterase